MLVHLHASFINTATGAPETSVPPRCKDAVLTDSVGGADAVHELSIGAASCGWLQKQSEHCWGRNVHVDPQHSHAATIPRLFGRSDRQIEAVNSTCMRRMSIDWYSFTKMASNKPSHHPTDCKCFRLMIRKMECRNDNVNDVACEPDGACWGCACTMSHRSPHRQVHGT